MGNACTVNKEYGKSTGFSEKRKHSEDSSSFQGALFVANPPDRNVFKYYELIRVIGEGSMGTIMKVRRRSKDDHLNVFEKFFGVILPWWVPPQGSSHHTHIHHLGSDDDCNEKNCPQMAYAVKAIQKDQINEIYHEEMRNEIEILKHLDHPNIVRIFESFEHKRQIYLVMEYCSGGDLYERCHPYTEEETAKIITKILSAVAYMHKRGVVHRDLKFENILFENKRKNANIKIIDFGLSKIFKAEKYRKLPVMTDFVGTLYTMAPEVLRRVYTYKADIWAVGVITYIMLSGRKPFYGKKRTQVVKRISNCDYNFDADVWTNISEEAKKFISCCIQIDPSHRPRADVALRADFLTKRPHHNFNVHTMKKVQESLVAYAQCNKLKQLALMVIAHKSSMDEVAKLRQVFSKYDSDKDGIISLTEFKTALADSNLSEEDIDTIFHKLDVNNYGGINYTEFLAATLETQGRIETGRLAEAFDRFDVDNTGCITKKDLVVILGKKRGALVDEIFDELKTTKAGKISYEEFLNLFSERMGEEMRQNLVSIMSDAHLMLDDEPSHPNSVHENDTISEGKEDASSLMLVDHSGSSWQS